MGRRASVRVKNGHWYSEAGGHGRYLGKVSEVSQAQATAALYLALAGVPYVKVEADPPPKVHTRTTKSPTVAELRASFLNWLGQHRGKRTHYVRGRHLLRFSNMHCDKPAHAITAAHLEAFLATLATQDWRHKHEVSVRAMYRWGLRHGHLPPGHDPFRTVEPTRQPAKVLLEADLPTPEEVRAILAHSTPTLKDILVVQHATGARTGELLAASVGDYQRATRQIVLRHHKREHTMRVPRARVIVLNDVAVGVVSRLCEGRPAEAPLFTTPKGKRWTQRNMSYHFMRARAKARVRDTLTPYILRHLWISEALMAGLDVMLVARMAGTSIRMIEVVYGRFRSQSLSDAQARLDLSRSGRAGGEP